jgi:tetratricopeptide (TPR) repeat protein
VPTTLQWRGRTHETLCGARADQRRLLPDAVFWEVPKSPDAHRAKLERDLVILRDETRDQPTNARWWYYFGQTLDGLGQKREAVEAYERCARLDGWAEEAAWACYQAAKCSSELKQYRQAVELCALGLTRQAGSPELAWLAGWCSFQMGADLNALHWSQMAVSLGHFVGNRAGDGRISFRHLPAWYESPFDVLRFAYRRLGRDAEARDAERHFHSAKQARLRQTRGESHITRPATPPEAAR